MSSSQAVLKSGRVAFSHTLLLRPSFSMRKFATPFLLNVSSFRKAALSGTLKVFYADIFHVKCYQGIFMFNIDRAE